MEYTPRFYEWCVELVANVERTLVERHLSTISKRRSTRGRPSSRGTAVGTRFLSSSGLDVGTAVPAVFLFTVGTSWFPIIARVFGTNGWRPRVL